MKVLQIVKQGKGVSLGSARTEETSLEPKNRPTAFLALSSWENKFFQLEKEIFPVGHFSLQNGQNERKWGNFVTPYSEKRVP